VFIATPFGALFLLLAASITSHGPTTGIKVTIATATPCGMDDRRDIVVQMLSAATLKINSEDLRPEDLDRRLEEIYRTRAERVMFLLGDGNLSFRDIVEILDTAVKYVDYVALVTPTIARQVGWQTGNCLNANVKPPFVIH
jgi:biopolymer transport protein ExbD